MPTSQPSLAVAHSSVHLKNNPLTSECPWQVHKLCQASADKILDTFQPNLMIAIGGGGYIPARILRFVRLKPQLDLGTRF